MKNFTTPFKHDPDGIDIDNNFEDTMTTEEKKCPKCKKGVNSEPYGGNENCFHCSDCGYIECGEDATPPQTGREWEKEFDDTYGGQKSLILEDPFGHSITVNEELKSFFRSVESSALAQGEKIGAEKERARLSGWLMHDDNCKGLYFDPKKTSKCDCGLADALKG